MGLHIRQGFVSRYSKLIVTSFIALALIAQPALYSNNFASAASLPDAPALQTPVNNAVLNKNQFWFDWTDIDNAASYEFRASQTNAVDADGALNVNVWHGDANGNQPTVSQAQSSGANGTWYWQVRAVGADDTKGTWTNPWKLTINLNAPDTPNLISPENNAHVQGASVTNSWTAAAGADHYVYESWNDQAMTSLRWRENFTSTSKTATNVTDSTFWWRVKAVSTTGDESGWSELWRLTIDSTPPTATITQSNNNGADWTNNNVTSTLVASEPITTPSGWTQVSETTYTKVHASNTSENVTITDFANNSTDVPYTVEKIDKTDPSFNISDGSTQTAASVSVGISEQNLDKIIVDGDEATPSGSAPDYTIDVSGQGEHKIKATDNAGNSATLTFSIDSIAPKLTINIPVRNLDGSYLISGTTDDTADVVVSIAGTTYTLTPTSNSWSFTTAPLIDGNYFINATSSDAASNTGPAVTYAFTATTPVVILGNTDDNNDTGNDDGTSDSSNTTFLTQLFNGDAAAVLGTKDPSADDSNDTNTPTPTGQDVLGTTAQPLLASNGSLSFLGIAWYWWLLLIAAIAVLWWLIAARRQADLAE